MSALEEQLARRDLVVFLGTGGVGKTTIAAASALHAARTRKTLVLTIDPARRLADSLGVKLGSEIANVRPNLDALMLDTKAALDTQVRRHAKNPDTLNRILRSRFYEQLSDAFAGSEEFVAMGMLHDLLADAKYELIVVDTPPSAHAIEFLRVNEKLMRVYDSGVVKYLFKPTRFLRLGGGYMAKMMGQWTTSEYVEEFAEFMTTFDQMFIEMEQRVRTMQNIITDPVRTSLNIVAAPEEEAVSRAARLYHDVAKLNLQVSGCIVNRYHPPLPGMEVARMLEAPEYRAGTVRRLAQVTSATQTDAEHFLDDAMRAASFYAALARDEARWVERLRADVPSPLRLVPALAGSVHDLAGLERVRGALFGA